MKKMGSELPVWKSERRQEDIRPSSIMMTRQRSSLKGSLKNMSTLAATSTDLDTGKIG